MDSTSEQRAERSDRGDSGSAAKTSHAVDTRLPEVELGVDLLDVTKDILPMQVHGAVLAELAAPADQRGGQEDGAGDVRLLRHSVGLPHMALHEVQCVSLHCYARELD